MPNGFGIMFGCIATARSRQLAIAKLALCPIVMALITAIERGVHGDLRKEEPPAWLLGLRRQRGSKASSFGFRHAAEETLSSVQIDLHSVEVWAARGMIDLVPPGRDVPLDVALAQRGFGIGMRY
mmetsp:Transcript_11056/g.40490  ORF Transcript_11056/g.40490 Transcript_11056/m.40490 type:complete len:125 (-) Transcript_11056:959-1333(-)